MKKASLKILSLLISVTYFSCGVSDDDSTTTNNNTTVQVDTVIKEKSDVEKGIEIASAGIEAIKDLKENSDQKAEERNANKNRMWVYQIGDAYDDDKLAGQAYDKIKEIPNIYVFKKANGEYYLIKDDGYSTEEQLMDSLGSCKRQIAAISSFRVDYYDLSFKCTSRKQPTSTDPIKYKINKEKKTVECKACE